jgi:hypothetical protein
MRRDAGDHLADDERGIQDRPDRERRPEIRRRMAVPGAVGMAVMVMAGMGVMSMMIVRHG